VQADIDTGALTLLAITPEMLRRQGECVRCGAGARWGRRHARRRLLAGAARTSFGGSRL